MYHVVVRQLGEKRSGQHRAFGIFGGDVAEDAVLDGGFEFGSGGVLEFSDGLADLGGDLLWVEGVGWGVRE